MSPSHVRSDYTLTRIDDEPAGEFRLGVSPFKSVPSRVERYHQLWDQLHTQVNEPWEFVIWCAKVPSFGCSCKAWLKDYVADNRYPDPGRGGPIHDYLEPALREVRRHYGFTLHNAVNAKLRAEGKDRPEFSWDAFVEKYPRNVVG